MTQIDRFQFARSRGVIWVCDIIGSSSYLDNNETADALETFLPRLYWCSLAAVRAAGGLFVKWVGDGFLAWFETELHRHLPHKAYYALQAAYQLTLLVNVTQLGVATERKFHIRHGLAYEHDALVTSISHSDGHQSSDITGRAVVLAFRMAGVDSAHPRIVAQKQIVDAVRCEGPISIRFRKWRISADDRLRYFKGQKWGTDSIYRSSGPSGREPSIKPLLSRAKRFIRTAEGHPDAEAPATPFAERFLASMLSGPDWAIRSICDFADLIGSVIDPLKHFVEIAESNKGGFDGNGHITN